MGCQIRKGMASYPFLLSWNITCRSNLELNDQTLKSTLANLQTTGKPAQSRKGNRGLRSAHSLYMRARWAKRKAAAELGREKTGKLPRFFKRRSLEGRKGEWRRPEDRPTGNTLDAAADLPDAGKPQPSGGPRSEHDLDLVDGFLDVESSDIECHGDLGDFEELGARTTEPANSTEGLGKGGVRKTQGGKVLTLRGSHLEVQGISSSHGHYTASLAFPARHSRFTQA